MKESSNLPFLARSGYRRRRLIEAVRVMPIVGVLLFLMPVLWASKEQDAETSGGWLYLFGAWFILIGLAALASRAIAKTDESDNATDSGSNDL